MALIFGGILFNQVIGPLTVICVLAGVAAIFLLRWEQLPRALTRSLPLFSLPVFCIASALWSDHPDHTLYYAALYGVTALAGILIGGALKRSSYVEGYFVAFAIYSIACVLFGRSVVFGVGGSAYAGLAGSKNTAGDMAGVATLVTLAFIGFKIYRYQFIQAIGALALLPIFGVLLLLSKATGALLATIMASGLIVVWLISRSFSLQVRGTVLTAAVILLTLAVVTQDLWIKPVFDLVLDVSGKGTGLTGRVDIWVIGDQLIEERPAAGLGYYAFWMKDNLTAQIIWEMMGIKGQSGFNFHNTQMEIVVHLGYIGLAIAIVMAAWATIPLVYRSVVEPYFSSICACTLLVFFAVKVPFEVVAFDPMHFTTVTIYAIFALGLRRDAPAREPKTQRPQTLEQAYAV
ncbi:MAG: O-antigen ligase family protein [Pseudomonadota bacterium]